MGMFGNWFSKESKEEHDRNIAKINETNFIYGNDHKEKIKEVLNQLIEKEDKEMKLYNYLTCKAIVMKNHDDVQNNIGSIYYEFKKQIIGNKKQLFKYIALVEADLKVDEKLEYPSIDELNKRALVLKALVA